MRDLGALTAGDFEPLIGTDFEVPGSPGDAPVLVIRLVDVERLKERPGHRQPFVLHFAGPTSPILAQEIHHLAHPDLGELEIFIGPVMSESPGITYEAVFI